MNEESLLPSPNWYLSNVLACSVDGSVAYGSRNNIVIVRHLLGNSKSESSKISIIQNAHLERVTAIAFSRSRNSDDKYWNCLASAGEDSIIRLWNLNTLMPIYAHNSHVEGMKACCMDWSVFDTNLIVSADDSGSIVFWDLFSNTTQKLSLGKLVPTCLACCPHRRDLVALGTRSGLVCTVSLKGGGKMLHRLRGHDAEVVSLAWCPVSYNVVQQKEDQQDILLASGAKEKTIYIWRVGGDGRYETTLNLPTLPLNTGGIQQHRSRLSSSATCGSGGIWISVSWPEASTILSSSLWGELLSCNLKNFVDFRSSKQPTGKLWQLVHSHHIRGLFSIACTPAYEFIQNRVTHEEIKFINGAENNGLVTKEHDTNVESSGQSQVVWTTAQDRLLIACYWKTGEVVVNVPTLGGFVYCIATSPLDSNRIAFGVGDGTIRVWNLSNSSSVDMTSLWQKIKGKVMALAWHPEKEGWLAYGTSEGRVGLYDVSSGKPPVLFRPYHRRIVYTLCWGPAVYKQGDEAINGTFLYSCGDGHIVRYNLKNPNEEPYNLKDMFETSDKNMKKEIFRTEMAWKPDNTMLAVGNEDGTVHIFSTPHLLLVHVLFAHKKLVQCIVWHPESTATDTGYSVYQHWLAVSSNETHIKVFDLSPLMKGDGETESNKVIPVQNCITLSGHLNRVVSMCWSPHIGGHLVSVSFDNTAQVWNVCTQQPIANFCSHTNNVFCCVWSPFDPDLVITGSADFTLRVWRVSSQIQTLPSERKKQKKMEMKKIKASSAIEVKSFVPNKGDDDTIVPAVLNEESSEVEYARTQKEACEAGVVDEITKKKKKKTFTRKSFFPASSQQKNNGIEQHFRNCCHLLAALDKNSSPVEEVSDIPSGEFPSYLGFFGNQDAVQRLLDVEVEYLNNGENFEMAQNIELWRGNVTEMLKEALRRKQLSDWLVSLAPMASQRLWMDMCKAYSEQLVVCEQYHKAASYLLACHRVNEAIDLLVNHHLFREALAIARSRLGPDDPTSKKIICAWGRQVASEGNYELAAECLISVGELLEAAMLIRKRNDEGSLKLAALIADKAGAQDLAVMLANQSIKQSLLTGKWDIASDLVKQHPHLKHLGLLLTVRQTLAELAAVTDSSLYVKWLHNCSIFPFAHTSLIEVILCRWKSDFTDEEAQKICTSLLNEFSQKKAPDTTEKLWFAVSVEIALACVNTDIKRLKHMVLALGMCYQYRQLQPSAGYLLLQLCVWITPKGPFAEMSPFCTRSSEEGIITSLQAYLCAGVVDWIVDHVETQSREVNANSELSTKDADVVDHVETQSHEVNANSELSTKDADVVDSLDANNEKQTCVACGENSEWWNDFLKVFKICISAIVAKESLQYFQDCVKIKKWEHETAIAFAKSRKQVVQISDAGEKEDDISLSQENISDNSETDSMLHKLKELKERKQAFEETFISTPNPFVTYCKIKNLFHVQKEDSFSSDLCEQFESLWKSATLNL